MSRDFQVDRGPSAEVVGIRRVIRGWVHASFMSSSGFVRRYTNVVWDTQENGGTGGFHRFSSIGAPGTATDYDGPGTWGVDTSGLYVESVKWLME